MEDVLSSSPAREGRYDILKSDSSFTACTSATEEIGLESDVASVVKKTFSFASCFLLLFFFMSLTIS